MKNENLTEVFKSIFKFGADQVLRHKGDGKSSIPDMGLMVLQRMLIETVDDEGSHIYEKYYICRMMKYSGSGELAQFREKELMSVEEWQKQSAEDEEHRNQMRTEVKQKGSEIYAAFGLTEGGFLFLKNAEGEVLKDTKYRVRGWHYENGKSSIRIRPVISSPNDEKQESMEISDPSLVEPA